MPKVSIIAPIYNVEPYFDQCVQSLLNQSYRDIEIILVDDGSPDGCPAMCDAYAEQDNRVRVVHQENQGVSVARNTGIDLAEGEWIMFCDPDDWYNLNAVELLLDKALKTESDVAAFSFEQSSQKEKKQPENTETKIYDTLQDFVAISHIIWPRGVNAKIYKKSILHENNIRFTPGIAVAQDLMFSLKTLFASKRVSLSPIPVYNYRIFDASCSHRYRPDILEYYKRIDEELVNLLSKFPDDIRNSILSFQRAELIRCSFYKTYMHPDAPLSFRQRLKGMRDTLNIEPWKTATKSKFTNIGLKNQVRLFFLRHRLVLFLYVFTKLWAILPGRK